MIQHGSDAHQQWVLSDWFCSHTHDSSNVGMPELHPLGNFIHGLQGNEMGCDSTLYFLLVVCFAASKCLLLFADVEIPNAVSLHCVCRCLQWGKSALQQPNSCTLMLLTEKRVARSFSRNPQLTQQMF